MRTIAIIGAVVLAPFLAYLAYYAYAQSRAESRAHEFCDSSALGSDVTQAVSRAQELNLVRHGYSEQQGLFTAAFQGAVFNAFLCELTVADGKVTSRRVLPDGD